uniref:Ig-like domain-containing protein n=1 Tax=Latimeria chalumnae TaxID=7897 RepID=H3B7D1_LATCH
EMYISALIVFLILCREGAFEPQQPPSVEAAEGKEVNLPCNYSLGTSDNLYWYKQTKESMKFLIQGYKDTKNESHYTLTIATDRKNSTLTMWDVGLQDTAVYYCVAAA